MRLSLQDSILRLNGREMVCVLERETERMNIALEQEVCLCVCVVLPFLSVVSCSTSSGQAMDYSKSTGQAMDS